MPGKAVKGALVLVALAGVFALNQLPGVAGVLLAAEGDVHPAIEPDEALLPCQDCHAAVTEDVVNEWWTGPHGKFGVKCFVCHGSPGEDFNASPEPDFCVSCHQDQVESMTGEFMAGRDCFSCHPKHLLIPHLSVQEYRGVRQ